MTTQGNFLFSFYPEKFQENRKKINGVGDTKMGGVIGVNKHRKGQFVERSGSGNHLSESCVTQSGNSGENRKRRHWEHAIFGD